MSELACQTVLSCLPVGTGKSLGSPAFQPGSGVGEASLSEASRGAAQWERLGQNVPL
jgi:hypothetical protein